MRTFQVGDRFQSNDVTDIVEVRWVHPQDPYCAVVFNVANQFEDETVFASDFFGCWTLVEEGTESLAA
ncbi:MAG TPA: hypothetical protein VH558_02210 [Pseudolabrys sp.]|jgi:hypothetical protein